jgi:hypothetical protein
MIKAVGDGPLVYPVDAGGRQKALMRKAAEKESRARSKQQVITENLLRNAIFRPFPELFLAMESGMLHQIGRGTGT